MASWSIDVGGEGGARGTRTRGAGPACRTPCRSAAAACWSSGAAPCVHTVTNICCMDIVRFAGSYCSLTTNLMVTGVSVEECEEQIDSVSM